MECPRCHYQTPLKANLVRHLKKKEECPPLFSLESRDEIIQELTAKPPKNTCTWCNKHFAQPSGLCKHKKICKLGPNQNPTIQQITNNTTINNNNNNTNNNINIAVYQTPLPFLHEKLEHLSDDYFVKCAKRLDNGLIDLIKNIRFNPEHPENMNVKIHLRKQKTLYVFDGQRWSICDAKWTLEEMIIHGARILYQKMLTQLDQQKMKDEDSTESKIQSWLLSVLPRNNDKIMGNLSRRIYALILDNQLLLLEQQTEDDHLLLEHFVQQP
jgi:hypothetical protein